MCTDTEHPRATQMMDEEDNQIVPSPAKKNDPKALTSAMIVACTNPLAWHKYGAKELAGWVVNRQPDIPPESVTISYNHGMKGFEIQPNNHGTEHNGGQRHSQRICKIL